MDFLQYDLRQKSFTKVYFVGIKGVGMTALACMVQDAGLKVRGSDVAEEFLTDDTLKKRGIQVDTSFATSFLDEFIDGNREDVLVVTTAAHDGLSNPQSSHAQSLGVAVLTHGQTVGYFMKGDMFGRKFKGVSVLGCHGKTTVSAMAATALLTAGMDPSYCVGSSELFPIGSPGHLGKGEYFVAEADEFVSDVQKDRTIKFFYQHPQYAIFNNVDFDHPDVYKSLDEVKRAFFIFALENIQQDGALILNGDDPELQNIKSQLENIKPGLKIVTFGEESLNMFKIENFREVSWGSEFDVSQNGSSFGHFQLSVPGYHNAKNALGVLAFMHTIKVSKDVIGQALASFTGTKRRQERLGQTEKGATLIDDYAHHPQEIQKTITAVKTAFPDKKIITVFQPHTISRTQSLRDEFIRAFTGSENVLFLPIFPSKREGEEDYSQLYAYIEKGMQEAGQPVVFFKDSRTAAEKVSSPYFFQKNRQDVLEYVKENFDRPENVLLFLGAGDLYKLAYDLKK
ncbi:MAG: UDP-N-acetylmuramate--L-alanine ligase [Candidatus Levyibacteriota bacterium]